VKNVWSFTSTLHSGFIAWCLGIGMILHWTFSFHFTLMTYSLHGVGVVRGQLMVIHLNKKSVATEHHQLSLLEPTLSRFKSIHMYRICNEVFPSSKPSQYSVRINILETVTHFVITAWCDQWHTNWLTYTNTHLMVNILEPSFTIRNWPTVHQQTRLGSKRSRTVGQFLYNRDWAQKVHTTAGHYLENNY
jgi:hypothetical protein